MLSLSEAEGPLKKTFNLYIKFAGRLDQPQIAIYDTMQFRKPSGDDFRWDRMRDCGGAASPLRAPKSGSR